MSSTASLLLCTLRCSSGLCHVSTPGKNDRSGSFIMGRYYTLQNESADQRVSSHWTGDPPTSEEVTQIAHRLSWSLGDTIYSASYADIYQWNWNTLTWVSPGKAPFVNPPPASRWVAPGEYACPEIIDDWCSPHAPIWEQDKTGHWHCAACALTSLSFAELDALAVQ